MQERPLMTLLAASERTGLSFPTASKAMRKLEGLGIVREITDKKRDRVYAYEAYLGVLRGGVEGL